MPGLFGIIAKSKTLAPQHLHGEVRSSAAGQGAPRSDLSRPGGALVPDLATERTGAGGTGESSAIRSAS